MKKKKNLMWYGRHAKKARLKKRKKMSLLWYGGHTKKCKKPSHGAKVIEKVDKQIRG